MVKLFIKFGLINIACIINLVAILLVVNHWFSLKPIIIKIVIYLLIGIGILSTIVLSSLSLKPTVCEKIIDILNTISFIVFGICVLLTVTRISHLGFERGSSLYEIYSLPALLPLISGLIMSVLRK